MLKMKIVFVRPQDYWIFPLSLFGVVFTTTLFYAGINKIGLLSGLAGFSILYFMTYIIRKNYNRRLAALYLLWCLSASILTAYVIYLLTN